MSEKVIAVVWNNGHKSIHELQIDNFTPCNYSDIGIKVFSNYDLAEKYLGTKLEDKPESKKDFRINWMEGME